MSMQWISEERSFLGDVPETVLRAKALLLAFKSTHGTVPVADYGTKDDLTSYWSARDHQMMNAFVEYWTSVGGQPATKQAQSIDYEPTPDQLAALEVYAASPLVIPGLQVTPGQTPPGGSPYARQTLPSGSKTTKTSSAGPILIALGVLALIGVVVAGGK